MFIDYRKDYPSEEYREKGWRIAELLYLESNPKIKEQILKLSEDMYVDEIKNRTQ